MGCIKPFALLCSAALILAAGYVFFYAFQNATSWSQAFSSTLIAAVMAALGLSLGSAFMGVDAGDYSPQIRPAIAAIDADKALAVKTLEQYSNPTWEDINRKKVHLDLDYEVYNAKVDGQYLTIARNQASGTYGVVVDGKVLGNGMRPDTTKRVIQKHFHIDPNLPHQKPMPPSEDVHSTEHGMTQIDDPDRKFWDIF